MQQHQPYQNLDAPPPPPPPPSYSGSQPPPPPRPSHYEATGVYMSPSPYAVPEPSSGFNTKRPISPKQVILLVLGGLCLSLAIAAVVAKWSKIEDKIIDIKLNFDFYLTRVKLHGDATQTWDNYGDFKKDYEDSAGCSNFAKKFKKASDGARGVLFLPFLTLVVALVSTVISMITRGSKPLANTIMVVAWFALIVGSLLPATTWSSSIPTLDDVKDCLPYTDLTYYPVEGGASLFFVITVIAIICAVIALLESKSAKRHYEVVDSIHTATFH